MEETGRRRWERTDCLPLSRGQALCTSTTALESQFATPIMEIGSDGCVDTGNGSPHYRAPVGRTAVVNMAGEQELQEVVRACKFSQPDEAAA